jgi:hypothetical protein
MIFPKEALPYILHCRKDNIDEWALDPNNHPVLESIRPFKEQSDRDFLESLNNRQKGNNNE